MLHEMIHLNNFYKLDNDPILEVMIPFIKDENNHDISKGILILPGGAYSYTSKREGDPVALAFMMKGYCTFILHYTTKTSYPTPMIEVACAIDYLRKNSLKYYLNKDQIIVCGFSAGGHLAASYGYLHKNQDFLKRVDFLAENINPNGLILCYPVITMGEYTHLETRQNITGGNQDLYEFLSVEKHVDKDYPPTFIWTTNSDNVVPYCNSVMLVEQLNKFNVPNEFHLFPFLDHGKSIGNDLVNEINKNDENKYEKVSTWVDKSFNFLKRYI